MLTQERVRPDDEQCLAPAPDMAGQPHQQRPIGRGAARPFAAATQAGKLVTEEGMLGHERRSALRQIGDAAGSDGSRERASGGHQPVLEAPGDSAGAHDQARQQASGQEGSPSRVVNLSGRRSV